MKVCVTHTNGLACPIDGSPLSADDASLRCANGHSFDRSREGYVNLLVVQHKASRDPGDSKEMVAARRRHLDGGHYAPIATHLERLVTPWVVERASPTFAILDAGCGEGYYLDRLMRAVRPAGVTSFGIDISKWAVRAAAKRNRDCCWAVASNRHLPFAAGSIDLILSMFGFPLWDAFAPVQPAGGRVVLVDPGPDHLIEMRRIIYGEVAQSDPPSLAAATAAGYRQRDEQRLQFSASLPNAAAISDLLSMTPHGHRAPAVGRAALAALDRLEITGDVVFRVLAR